MKWKRTGFRVGAERRNAAVTVSPNPYLASPNPHLKEGAFKPWRFHPAPVGEE